MQSKKILNIEEINQFKNLLVFARFIVEGYYSGKHKSPYFGSSAEFAEYRQYIPGDNISEVDWRIYSKTRRLFTRKYREETDMAMYLLVDTSCSMGYCNSNNEKKILLAARIAAAFAYLMVLQGDKVSLSLFDEKVYFHLPPGGTRNHLYNIIHHLEKIEPKSGTEIYRAITECTSIFRKCGKIVIISDFFSDLDVLFDALDRFLHRKFEILLLHVLDNDELQLPDLDNVRFVDMETGEKIQVAPGEIRSIYKQQMQQVMDKLSRKANLRCIHYDIISTDQPYLRAIEAYLKFHSKGGKG